MAVSPPHDDAGGDEPERSAPTKRIRWATQRVTGGSGTQKRKSIWNRQLNRMGSTKEKRESAGSDPKAEDDEKDAAPSPGNRTIYFNQPLPPEAKDEEGHPLVQYKRNKIRTAKYTPISFLPKNLWLQFHNIANVYFLFIIILSIFPIFGAENPGLSAVPLIVIIVVTAVKDGIEDWRRTVLDNELNNAPVHRLVDWQNVNTADEVINPWRKTKKATTRGILWVWQQWKDWKAKKGKGGKDYSDRALDLSAEPQDDRRYSVWSRALDDDDEVHAGENENGDMEMTPVPSPTPGQKTGAANEYFHGDDKVEQLQNDAAQPDDLRQQLEVPAPGKSSTKNAPVAKKFYGSLVDSTIDAPETARFKKEYWKSVQVGDFVRLYNEEEIPADIIVLSTSDSDGACYVETKNLDGETNLKVRQALHTGRKVRRARDCERTNFRLESEPPHANLYSYSGAVRWQQKDEANPGAPLKEMAEPVGINNMLLRGCTLRNTDWVVGIVAFTGEDTKIMLNSGITPTKRAQISKDLNVNVLYNFAILFIMCLVAAVVQGWTFGKGNESLDFFEVAEPGGEPGYGSSPGINGFITFWAAIILFQNLVPISLYISLEIVRTAQAFFIYSDTFMYYEKIDYPCTPKSWNISDDVGQIEYIFSDKTGTLTQNVMEFKKCTINGVPYGEAYTEAQAGMQKRQGIDTDAAGAQARAQIAKDRDRMLHDIRRMHDNPYLRDEDLTFVAPDFINDLAGESGRVQKEANERFMLTLALCHTVITERTPGDPPKIGFKAQSPDEAALVATAKDVGFTVMGRSNDGSIMINQCGVETEYTVLNTLEFNSTRKRMSAIIRMPDGKIVLLCKGADSIIYSRLKRGEQAELRKTTAEHLEMFAREGLRTLCIAMREIGEEEYQKWNIEHDLAAASVQDREDKLELVSDAIERELTLLGGTAIEDRLQDGVPDSIAILAQAGIKLWVLTGDKVETAINIGFSCNLLDNDMDLILLQLEEDSVDFAEQELDRHLLSFGKTGSDEELKAAKKNHEPPAPTHALVIDGDSLKLCLDDRIRQKFLLLCKECRSVLCCRVSPAQKAAVVRMVKNSLEVMTLSIGDGANDVAMIQEAHVGVGIAGEEGRQAVMSADYAIGQFRFLTRLVLVHGRWSYRRLAETIANFFYKNIVWTFALFWYQIYANFDCSYAFDYTYILLYNLAFTSLLVVFMGILDQDVDDKVSIAVPQLYRRGIERKEWTQLKFWIYMIDGLYQSVICFYFPYLLFRIGNFVTEEGRSINDYKRLGVYIAIPAVIVVNAYLMMNTYRWDWFMSLIAVVSTLLIFLWTGAYTSSTAGFTFYGAGSQVFGALSFWAVCLIAVVLCLLPRFVGKAVQKIYFPRDVDIIREQIRQGKFDYLKDVEPSKVSLAPVDKLAGSASSSEISKGNDKGKNHGNKMSEDMRPMYPPSVAPTATTHNPRSHNGSDGTDYTGHQRFSLDRAFPHINTDHTNMGGQQTFSGTNTPTTPVINAPFDHETEARNSFNMVPGRPSFDRPRPSFDRLRSSCDRTRASFEASRDFTSAAYLSRVESSNSANGQDAREGRNRANRASLQVNEVSYSREPSSSRRHDVSEDFR